MASNTTLMSMISEWEVMTAHIKNLPAELLDLTERELELKFKPDEQDKRLKVSFWEEYGRAFRDKDAMRVRNVLEGVINHTIFYAKVVRDPVKLAWLIYPPTDEMIVRKQMIKQGLDRMYEVLQMPLWEEKSRVIKKKDGTTRTKTYRIPNIPLIKVIKEIVQMNEDRVMGGVIQRAQIHAVSETKDQGFADLGKLDETIKKLQAAKKAAAGLLPETEILEAEAEVDHKG